MAQKNRRGNKVNVNFAADPQLVARFREATRQYLGRLGTCFSAAMAMWLAADPQEQGLWLKRVYEAEIDKEVQSLIEEIRVEQAAKTKERTPRRAK